MTKRFADRTVWITGASSGIGESLARALAPEGAALILSARREEKLRDLAAELEARGTPTLVLPLDVADSEAIPPAAEAARAWRGSVDVLINNAGISQRARVEDTEIHTVRRVMEVNFFGLVHLTGEVLPHMLAARRGHIVNISSVAGYVATPLRSSYSASKHAVRAWSDSLRSEVGDRDVHVTVICPGYVRTNIAISSLRGDGSQKGTPDKVVAAGMDPDVAARRMVDAIARRRNELIIGGKETYSVYLKRWLPGLTARFLPRFAPE